VRTLLLFGLCSIGFAQSSAVQRAAWNQPVKPFRIIGNIYYVGAANVSSFFIKTPQGAILLDGGLPETAPLIARSIA
jgi:metallo-beta-lactamase class B